THGLVELERVVAGRAAPGYRPTRSAVSGLVHAPVRDDELGAVGRRAEREAVLVGMVDAHGTPRRRAAVPRAACIRAGLAEDAETGAEVDVDVVRVPVARTMDGYPGLPARALAGDPLRPGCAPVIGLPDDVRGPTRD